LTILANVSGSKFPEEPQPVLGVFKRPVVMVTGSFSHPLVENFVETV